MKLMVDWPYHNAEMRSAGREAQAEKRASGDLAGSYISSLTAKPPGET